MSIPRGAVAQELRDAADQLLHATMYKDHPYESQRLSKAIIAYDAALSEGEELREAVALPEGLLDALRRQRQIDMDGDEVGVSRQAVDEAVEYLERAYAAHSTQPKAEASMTANRGKLPDTLQRAIHFLEHVQDVSENVYKFEFATLTSVLESLRARLAEASIEQEQWIPVTERLPEPGEWVLVYNGKWIGTGKHEASEEIEESERWQDEHTEFIEHLGPKVSHWMPLPTPPKTGTESTIPAAQIIPEGGDAANRTICRMAQDIGTLSQAVTSARVRALHEAIAACAGLLTNHGSRKGGSNTGDAARKGCIQAIEALILASPPAVESIEQAAQVERLRAALKDLLAVASCHENDDGRKFDEVVARAEAAIDAALSGKPTKP